MQALTAAIIAALLLAACGDGGCDCYPNVPEKPVHVPNN